MVYVRTFTLLPSSEKRTPVLYTQSPFSSYPSSFCLQRLMNQFVLIDKLMRVLYQQYGRALPRKEKGGMLTCEPNLLLHAT